MGIGWPDLHISTPLCHSLDDWRAIQALARLWVVAGELATRRSLGRPPTCSRAAGVALLNDGQEGVLGGWWGWLEGCRLVVSDKACTRRRERSWAWRSEGPACVNRWCLAGWAGRQRGVGAWMVAGPGDGLCVDQVSSVCCLK